MPTNSNNEMFDLKQIKRLVELMRVHELTELDIQHADKRIQLRRNVSVHHSSVASPLIAAPATVSVPPSVTISSPVPAEEREDENVTIIRSPMVGTFYAAPNPDTPPFVKTGDTVHAETTVCIIEAMKVYNEIQAECSGKIVAVLAKNGETVEFGKPLFKLKAVP
jgi:acetyl-CoA carboxylase biotin carboxyl carrier protein